MGLHLQRQDLRRLGLSAPRTYEEFVAVYERIKRAGIVPIYEPGASRWHTSLTFFEIGATLEERDPGLYERLNTNRSKFADYDPFRRALGQIISAANRGSVWTATVGDHLHWGE
jgi:raffinose/stachyose/melibiose transport system substrate-binding protein